MLRSRFRTLPDAFKKCFIPQQVKDNTEGINKWLICSGTQVCFIHFKTCTKIMPSSNSLTGIMVDFQGLEDDKNSIMKFVIVWNQIINSFREEDLINNRLAIKLRFFFAAIFLWKLIVNLLSGKWIWWKCLCHQSFFLEKFFGLYSF